MLTKIVVKCCLLTMQTKWEQNVRAAPFSRVEVLLYPVVSVSLFEERDAVINDVVLLANKQ